MESPRDTLPPRPGSRLERQASPKLPTYLGYANSITAALPDLHWREWVMLGSIGLAVLWMGVYPESFIAPMRTDIAALDARVARAAPVSDSKLKIIAPKAAPAASGGAH